MNAEMIARTIQLILAPVLMISASALLQNGVIGQYVAISNRIRSLNGERLELLWGMKENQIIVTARMEDSAMESMGIAGGGEVSRFSTNRISLTRERLQEIDKQLPGLLRLHKRTRDAALAIYWAILIFILDMCVIGLAVLSNSNAVATVGLAVFISGMIAFLFGVFTIAREIRASHWAIHYEVQRVLELRAGDGHKTIG